MRDVLSPSISVCDDVRQWISLNQSISQIMVHLSESRGLADPDFNEISQRKIVTTRDQFVRPTFPRYMALIRNVVLHTTSGYIELPSGQIVLDTAWIEENIVGNKRYFAKSEGKSIRMQGRWFSTILYWSENYYHWFCDVLPRLFKVIDHLPADVKIIVPPNMELWKKKSLEAIGIPPDRCVVFDGTTPWKLEEFYYAPPVAMTGDIETESIRWVQSKLKGALQAHLPQIQRRGKIYISRRNALKRRIVNEFAFSDVLTKYGFEVVVAEELTLDEQIGIFKTASHVVAPHGAGLANLLHCDPGTKVLEIFDPSTVRRCYCSLSRALELDYASYLGQHVNSSLKGEGDIFIDVDHFASSFHQWMGVCISNQPS